MIAQRSVLDGSFYILHQDLATGHEHPSDSAPSQQVAIAILMTQDYYLDHSKLKLKVVQGTSVKC